MVFNTKKMKHKIYNDFPWMRSQKIPTTPKNRMNKYKCGYNMDTPNRIHMTLSLQCFIIFNGQGSQL